MIASEAAEYELTFQGINTVNNESVEIKLWRTKKIQKLNFHSFMKILVLIKYLVSAYLKLKMVQIQH